MIMTKEEVTKVPEINLVGLKEYLDSGKGLYSDPETPDYEKLLQIKRALSEFRENIVKNDPESTLNNYISLLEVLGSEKLPPVVRDYHHVEYNSTAKELLDFINFIDENYATTTIEKSDKQRSEMSKEILSLRKDFLNVKKKEIIYPLWLHNLMISAMIQKYI